MFAEQQVSHPTAYERHVKLVSDYMKYYGAKLEDIVRPHHVRSQRRAAQLQMRSASVFCISCMRILSHMCDVECALCCS